MLFFALSPCIYCGRIQLYFLDIILGLSKSKGVPIQCFYGLIKDSTVRTLEYDNVQAFPDHPSNLVMGDGDGTVNLESLRLCGSFKGKPIHVNQVLGVDHTDIVSDKSVMNKIGQLLN